DEAGNLSGPSPVFHLVIDTTPPTIGVTSPSSGSTVAGSVAVTTTVSDNVGIAHVDFQIDTGGTTSVSASPYGYAWDTTALANGTHTLTATAFDQAGNLATASVSVTVQNGGGATVPAAPALVSANAGNANVGLSWNAPSSDGGSAITGYRIYRGTAS